MTTPRSNLHPTSNRTTHRPSGAAPRASRSAGAADPSAAKDPIATTGRRSLCERSGAGQGSPIARRRCPGSDGFRQTSKLIERNRRVEAYRRIVRPVVIHYARCTNESSEDLLQVGMMGLIRAAELYSDDRQTPFEAFARPHIRGAVLHYLRDVAPRVRLPRRQAELMERCRKACGTTGEVPAGPEAERRCRQDLGVGEDRWGLFQRQRRLNGALPLEDRSLQEREQALPLSWNWDGHHLDGEGGGDGQEPCTAAEADVETLLALLEAREREVVERVVLHGDSYRKVGAALGISAMTVQRCLRRGLDRLRRVLEDRRIRTGIPCCPAASAAPGC